MPSYCFCEGKQDSVYGAAVCPSACINMSQANFPDNNGPHYPRSWREGMSSPIRAWWQRAHILVVLGPVFAVNECNGLQIICSGSKNFLFLSFILWLFGVHTCVCIYVCFFIICFSQLWIWTIMANFLFYFFIILFWIFLAHNKNLNSVI